MKQNRILVLVSVLMMVLSSVAGCSKSADKSTKEESTTKVTEALPEDITNAPEASTELEEVTLTYYFPWNAQGDQDEVWAEVNKYVKEKINANIVFKGVDWGAWADKLNVVISAGDEWDLSFAANWIDATKYSDIVSKGVVAPIDDLLAQYAPTLSSFPSKYWDCTRVDGKIYGVFNQQVEATQLVMNFNKDLVDKYDLQDEIDKIQSYKDLDSIFEVVKAGEGNEVYIVANPNQVGQMIDREKSITPIAGGLFTDITNPDLPLYNAFEEGSPAYLLDYVKVAREWYEKGYYKDDIFAVTEWEPIMKSGNWFFSVGSYKPGCDVEFKLRFGHEVSMKLIGSPMVDPNGPTATMTVINANSKNKERAMMFLELMNSDKELFNMFCFGLEGKHYEKVDENTIRLIADSQYNPQSAWEFGNQFNSFVMEGQPADVWQQTKDFNDNAKETYLGGFNFNQENVMNEVANCNGVHDKFKEKLDFGIEDPDKTVGEYIDLMKSAGNDKIAEEVTRQLEEFKANK